MVKTAILRMRRRRVQSERSSSFRTGRCGGSSASEHINASKIITFSLRWCCNILMRLRKLVEYRVLPHTDSYESVWGSTRYSTTEAAERVPAWKLGATGDLLQGPAIAIRITKIGKRSPILHIDLTDVNAPFDQFLAHGFHVRDHHKKPFERSGLHGGDAHPHHDGAGRTGRGQLDKAQVLPDLLVKISVKAHLLRIKSLCAVNVCDRYRNQFEFHLHGSHGCFPLSLCLTILLLQVYPERRTGSTLFSANMLEEESPEGLGYLYTRQRTRSRITSKFALPKTIRF